MKKFINNKSKKKFDGGLKLMWSFCIDK